MLVFLVFSLGYPCWKMPVPGLLERPHLHIRWYLLCLFSERHVLVDWCCDRFVNKLKKFNGHPVRSMRESLSRFLHTWMILLLLYELSSYVRLCKNHSLDLQQLVWIELLLHPKAHFNQQSWSLRAAKQTCFHETIRGFSCLRVEVSSVDSIKDVCLHLRYSFSLQA